MSATQTDPWCSKNRRQRGLHDLKKPSKRHQKDGCKNLNKSNLKLLLTVLLVALFGTSVYVLNQNALSSFSQEKQKVPQYGSAQFFRIKMALATARKKLCNIKSELQPEIISLNYLCWTNGENTPTITKTAYLLDIIPLWEVKPDPNIVLSSAPIIPGSCWPIQGNSGRLMINLDFPCFVFGFTIEHLHPDIAGSAPKVINFYGKNKNQEIIKRLYIKYDTNYQAAQTFSFDEPVYLQSIIVVVLSNHGNKNFTCLYRIKVLGKTPLF